MWAPLVTTLADAVRRVKTQVRDDTRAPVLSDPDDYEEFIGVALATISERAPRELVVDVVCPGGAELPLPAEWVPQVSAVRQLEHPVGENPPRLLSGRAYSLYAAPGGAVLRLVSPVAAGATVRLTIVVPHVLDEDGTTLSPIRVKTLVRLAAAEACRSLAAHYSRVGDAYTGTDVTVRTSTSKELAARAATLQQLAEQDLPELRPAEDVAPAAAETSFATEAGWLTH
jgi:hypothetical protein